MTPDEIPDDPVSPGKAQALGWFQVLTDLQDAGFLREEAFEMVFSQWDHWWAESYAAHFIKVIREEGQEGP